MKTKNQRELGNDNQQFTVNINQKQKIWGVALLTLCVIGLSGLFLWFQWHRYQEMAKNEAIQLAESVEALLHTEHIAKLTGATTDLSLPEYIMTKASFVRLVAATNPFHFAYLMQEKDGQIIFLLDSEEPDSPDYSPPGQVYDEADAVLWEVFTGGKTVLTEPTGDRWGNWISALVPVKDPVTGETIAVFGLDYSAEEWNTALLKKMIPDLIIVLFMIILLSAILYISFQNRSIKKLVTKIALDEALYRSVFDQTPVGIAIMSDKSFSSQSELGRVNINPMFETILARSSQDLEQLTWIEITHPEDLKEDLEKFDLFTKRVIPGYSMEKRFIRPDGTSVWTNMKVAPLLGLPYQHTMHLCLIDDITKSKADLLEKEEIARENAFLAYHDYLTGSYNRRFFEKEFNRRVLRGDFPVAILRGNIDGFNEFNSTYGHLAGDQLLVTITERITACLSDSDILARMCGDDFAILVSGRDEADIRQYLETLNHHVVADFINHEKYQMVDISWGYSIQKKPQDPLDKIFDEAETFMNNRKFYNQKSIRSKTINVIMQTLFIKSEREKKHSERVGKLCEKTAEKLGLNKSQIDKVRVAGYLHDIGKIGVDEAILNKPGKLNAQEWEIMKHHPSKSAEILATTREYRDIAEIVSSHHERYDGSGYPNGLTGPEIPLMARIIAICDAYDAMTEKRTYHDPLRKKEAIVELKQCAGTHFDPEIVAVFVNRVIGEKTSAQ
ncbi:HD domain-containing phosphohydrolase [Acetobacterium wieringae]|uniref:HD domain-containing phosphohydrolase n=1 Tax=Acetobacterium wieringae TaxID=52694 RepID=UPI0026F19C16|nr:HD domain-containing phosphohydrolase [Acetobacterium wieringae]